MAKLKKGQKLCPNCKKINAARQRVCKHCLKQFVSKNTPIKNEIKDWQNIEIGTYIKVVQGTGPYFLPKRDSEEDGVVARERICMGDTGVYKVMGIQKDGLITCGTTIRNGGFSFLYMGPSKKSKLTGMQLEAHRILLKKVKKHGRQYHGDRNGRKRY